MAAIDEKYLFPRYVRSGGVFVPIINKVLALHDFEGGQTMSFSDRNRIIADEVQQAVDKEKKLAKAEGRESKTSAVRAKMLAKHDKWVVPTIAEWRVIMVFMGEINKCLARNGGTPLGRGWYHTSSNKNFSFAEQPWMVNLYSGYMGPVKELHDTASFRLISKTTIHEK